ncbi:hypothetical protein AVEN_113789-1 [Araneus ventricosus]|uniref:Uncharacterized protein n=1 Tax=Araneus ventricosus TaxID=182803 RepID=A0A4Y2U2E5_ARAVE|nr:hypothetical protein AVEN_113789-1 [Araneus ventricosus]
MNNNITSRDNGKFQQQNLVYLNKCSKNLPSEATQDSNAAIIQLDLCVVANLYYIKAVFYTLSVVYFSFIDTAGQLLKTDDTITHSKHKMQESKILISRISAGYSQKRCEYANFFLSCSPRDSTDKRFKGFDACGALLFQAKVLREYPPTNKNNRICSLTKE